MFALDRTAWWRRNVIGVTRSLLRFTIHGTLFRAVRRGLTYVLAPAQLQWVLEWAKDLLWPDGQLFEASPDRSDAEKEANREEARRRLVGQLPSALISLIGKEAAASGCYNVHEFTQAPILVRSLVYTILDLLLTRLFPTLRVHGVRWDTRHDHS